MSSDFRDCRILQSSPDLRRARLARAGLVGRSIRDNNRPARPDALLSIFISHTFSIYKNAALRHARLCVSEQWTISPFCTIRSSHITIVQIENVRLVRLMFLMGLKIPRKFQVFEKMRIKENSKYSRQWESKYLMEGVNDRMALRGWFSIISALCRVAGTDRREETVASWCIPVSADKH